jgi:NAD(P)-dependent dehydrogenase (short-subunit alcohol dehydrogenase family)
VTGPGSGIGRVTALVLIERGWRVVAADLDAEALAGPRPEGGDAGLTTVALDITEAVGTDDVGRAAYGASKGALATLTKISDRPFGHHRRSIPFRPDSSG